jgi:hypothetical protein
MRKRLIDQTRTKTGDWLDLETLAQVEILITGAESISPGGKRCSTGSNL